MAVEGYAAARDTRLRKARQASKGPNVEPRNSAKKLRDMARAFEEDSDIGKRALDILCTNIVGQEIIPEPMLRTESGELAVEANRLLSKLHRRWRRRPEASHTHNHGSAQRMAVRHWARDGEILAQKIRGNVCGFQHAADAVPFSYELISADRLPLELNSQDGRGSRNLRGRVVQGVAVNAWGEPQAYFFFPNEPSDLYSTNSYTTLEEAKRKTADNVLHLASRNRIGQVRGISQMATVLSRLEDVNEIDEAERVAARIAASIGLAVYDPNAPQMPADATDEQRLIDWDPGMTLHLDSEAKVEVFESDRPNDKLPAFIKRQLQHVAGGMGVGYSSLALDYAGNYSSQRQELVESFGVYGILWAEFIDKWEQPLYDEFVDMAVIANSELRSAMSDVDDSTRHDVEFSRPAMPWVDPDKEYSAIEKALDAGVDSKRRIIRSRGLVPDDIMQQNAEEKDADAAAAASRAPSLPSAPAAPAAGDAEEGDDDETAQEEAA